jgi:hypothetical protein
MDNSRLIELTLRLIDHVGQAGQAFLGVSDQETILILVSGLSISAVWKRSLQTWYNSIKMD